MITRNVDPGADASGDGTTSNLTSGDNTHAYDSFDAAAVAHLGGTLTDDVIIVCRSTTGAVDEVTGNGTSFDPTQAGYTVTLDFREDYRRTTHPTGDYQHSIKAQGDGVFLATGDGTAILKSIIDHDLYSIAYTRPILYTSRSDVAATDILENFTAILETRGYSNISTTVTLIGPYTETYAAHTARNCACYVEGRAANTQNAYAPSSNVTNVYAWNNTYVGGQVALGSNQEIGNNIVSGAAFIGTAGTNRGGNRSEDSSSPDAAGTAQTFSFYDKDNGDFRLKTYDTGAKEQGIDISSYTNAPTTDMLGTSRPQGSNWDSGVNEADPVTVDTAPASIKDADTSFAFTTTGFGTVTGATITNGSHSVACTGLAGSSGSYTADAPDVSGLSADTTGAPFTSEWWDGAELEVTDGTYTGQFQISWDAKTGWTVRDVAEIVYTGQGSIAENFTGGYPVQHDQIYGPSGISVAGDLTYVADSTITTDTGIVYFDQSDSKNKPFTLLFATSGRSVLNSVIRSVLRDVSKPVI